MFVTRAHVPVLGGALLVLSLAVAGCSTSSSSDAGNGTVSDVLKTQPTKAAAPRPAMHANVAPGATEVPVDRRISVSAQNATFTSVAVTSKSGSVPGRMSADKRSWTAGGLLEPGTSYTVRTSMTGESGRSVIRTSHFSTAALTLDQQTYPSFFPLDGQTVGVGQPVSVKFDVPVTDKASIEKHLHVVTQPAQRGSWHWISDNEVHWRPVHFWQPGTKVTVNADVNSVPAGNGIFGQLDRTETFTIGASHIYKININTDQLRVYDNGQFVRQIPVTTGQQPNFTTRSGIKVITEKLRHTRMNSETIGIDPHGPNGYNIGDVQYAMRLTYSGEFLHAAPWSVYAQGHENVSHGCTGMSTANAAWLYNHSLVGDVAEYTGTSNMMTLTNGFGDWNEPFSTYAQGSALH
ncbi:MAG: L,D-transpeptidase family protein [Nocardioides sp.]|nr:L,D-transpeptidase family protein [Nocardioides sp.]